MAATGTAAETDPLLPSAGQGRIRKVSELYAVDVAPDIPVYKDDYSSVDSERRRAQRKLCTVTVICVCFMIAEVIGGYISGSLAIMTDAAHLLSDFASFLISLFAIWIAGRPPTKAMSFGYHRAEILGAIASVFMIWLLTGVLVYEAILRIITPKPVDGKIMFITAVLGLLANIIMAFTLGHNHSIGIIGHSHSHGDNGNGHQSSDEGRGQSEGASMSHSHSHSENGGAKGQNVNVTAAFLHVLGDMVQSVGVMIAAAVIWTHPSFTVVDPICTFLFSVVVLFTTITLLRETIHVLMEGTPVGVDPKELAKDLEAIPGVAKAHDVHIWSITVGKPASSFHLTLEPNSHDKGNVLLAAQRLVCEKYGIHHSTVQLEAHDIESHCMAEDVCNNVCPTANSTKSN